MPGSRFVPDKWEPRDADIQWAVDKYRITKEEVERQLEEFRDHEFKRSYTDWNRCFRNWFRTAEKHSLLKREHVYRNTISELSDDERQRDIEKFHEQMKTFKVVK